jgi:hypothetical protein
MSAEFIEKILLQKTERFNEKTIGCENFRKVFCNSAIYLGSHQLTFLPAEFHLFIRIYGNNPDRFIKFYELAQYELQYCNNLITVGSMRYDLIYREIYEGVNRLIIKLSWNYDNGLFVVFRGENISFPMTFEEALTDFFRN